MRYLATFALMTIAGCHIDSVPQSAVTPSAMTETQVRIGLYYEQNDKLPTTLDILPIRRNYANRTVDVWGRPFRYVVDSDSTFSLASLGKDDIAGGVGDNSDLVRKFRIVDGEIDEVP